MGGNPLAIALDDSDYLIKREERIVELNIQNKLTKRGGYCPLCGKQQDPREMEDHHIAGRRNSNITIPVCYSCHRKLSDRQRRWPKDWTRSDNPPEVRMAFIEMGKAEIYKLCEEERRRIIWELSSKGD